MIPAEWSVTNQARMAGYNNHTEDYISTEDALGALAGNSNSNQCHNAEQRRLEISCSVWIRRFDQFKTPYVLEVW